MSEQARRRGPGRSRWYPRDTAALSARTIASSVRVQIPLRLRRHTNVRTRVPTLAPAHATENLQRAARRSPPLLTGARLGWLHPAAAAPRLSRESRPAHDPRGSLWSEPTGTAAVARRARE